MWLYPQLTFLSLFGGRLQFLDSAIQHKQVEGNPTPDDKVDPHDKAKTFFHKHSPFLIDYSVAVAGYCAFTCSVQRLLFRAVSLGVTK